jgi:hypothetical protein
MLLLHLPGLYKYLAMCTSIRKKEKKTDSHVEHLHVFLKGNGSIGDNDAIYEVETESSLHSIEFYIAIKCYQGF